jgi:glycosyltransferase involved in cell wall biosynthesis
MYGSDKVLLLLTQGLRRNRLFHPVVILPTSGPLYDALLNSDIEVHIGEVAKISRGTFTPLGLLCLPLQVCRAIRKLDHIVGKRKIALVHSNTLAVFSGAIWAFLRRKKHLWHVHEIILSPKLASKAFPYLVNQFSNRVVSNSSLTADWLLSKQPKLALSSVVIFNGLPSVRKPSEAAIKAFRKSVNAMDGDVIVTLAGRINRWKGQKLLLEAATELKRTNRLGSMRFVIVGGVAPGLDDLLLELKAHALSAGLLDNFSFVSFVDDIWPIWFGTDIAVVPSTEPEPFGMVAIEAMAASAPVIAAGHGGLLDIVIHEETGILFAPCDAMALANAIERLAKNQALRERFGAAGAERQRTLFSIDSQVEHTEKIYGEMQE